MLLFFDTETTGKPRRYDAPLTDLQNWPRVVQLGWVQCDNDGRESACGECLIVPDGFRIPAEASRIHGITTERATQFGQPLQTVLAMFAELLKSARVMIAHNISFDRNVLGAEYLRAGLGNPLAKLKRVCTMQASTNYCKLPGNYGYKYPKLAELYQVLFQRPLVAGHTALADVRACAECYFELKRRGVLK